MKLVAQGCYFIRRLANNLGEPQRSYAINAIDRALTFWKAKRVKKPVPLRAPWLLAPNWTRDLRQLLTSHVHRTRCYNTTLQTPSTRDLSSRSSRRLWTACATTRKPLPSGLTAKPQSVPATHYDLMLFIITNLITTWSWRATTYISMKAHTHPSRRVRFKTKSSHPPKKSRHPLRLALRTWTTRNASGQELIAP